MTGEFGLWPLINKRVAIISDARLGARSDAQVVAERLLSISGEDDQNINRKNQSFWSGQLRVRFLIMTNTPPRIADASGALVSRYVVLTLHETFYGREDRELTDKLLTELPGILNWSLQGLDRLYQRGYFKIPKASLDMVRALEDAASPVGAFVREWCEVGPDQQVNVKKLFAAYKVWCERQGDQKPGIANQFGMHLREVIPTVRAAGKGINRYYEGVCLNPEGAKRFAKSIRHPTA
jgi:putative DNA primase/helicase